MYDQTFIRTNKCKPSSIVYPVVWRLVYSVVGYIRISIFCYT